MKFTNYWAKAQRYAPVIVRLLCDKTDEELAATLPMSLVKRLSWECSWDHVTFGEMRAFCLVCGVDLGDPVKMRRFNRLLTKGKMVRLANTPEKRERLKLYVEYLQGD